MPGRVGYISIGHRKPDSATGLERIDYLVWVNPKQESFDLKEVFVEFHSRKVIALPLPSSALVVVFLIVVFLIVVFLIVVFLIVVFLFF
jgi:hypothetical protein